MNVYKEDINTRIHRNSFWLVPVITCFLIWGCSGEGRTVPARLLAIKQAGSYGYINEKGAGVIKPNFVYAVDFSEGLGAVNIGGSAIGKDMPRNGKWGFINEQQKIVINPKYYSPAIYAPIYSPELLSYVLHEAYQFSEGLAAVRTEHEWIYIDKNDSVKISGLKIQAARKFSEGLAAVMMNGRWGYIDMTGKVVIPARYIFPANFKQGYAYVMDEELNTYCIDKNGKRLYSQYRIAGNFRDGYAPVKAGYRGDKFDRQENLKMGLIDSTGLVTVDPHFECVREYGSGLAPALVGSDAQELLQLNDDFRTLKNIGGKWGYINTGGRFGINPQFDDAKAFSEGLAPVKLKGRWGYIDSTGKWIYTPQFKWAGAFNNGIAKVMLDDPHKRPYVGSRALISKKGVIWIEP